MTAELRQERQGRHEQASTRKSVCVCGRYPRGSGDVMQWGETWEEMTRVGGYLGGEGACPACETLRKIPKPERKAGRQEGNFPSQRKA